MVTAVDSSVLLDVLLNDPQHAPNSIAALRQAATEGSLVICETTLAEIVPTLSGADLPQFLSDWSLAFVPSSQASATLPNRPEDAMQKLEKPLARRCNPETQQPFLLLSGEFPRPIQRCHRQFPLRGLEFKESFFRFSGTDQVRASAERLESNNIKESEETYTGEFQGVLPKGRTFEFKVSDGSGVLRGKVGPDVEDADVLNREYLHKLVNVSLHVIQVGQGRPRFTLQKLSDIKR